jgi:hypothetical protein
VRHAGRLDDSSLLETPSGVMGQYEHRVMVWRGVAADKEFVAERIDLGREASFGRLGIRGPVGSRLAPCPSCPRAR